MSQLLDALTALIQRTVYDPTARTTIVNVVAIDVRKRTCTVKLPSDNGHEIPNVKLMACVDDGFLLVPAVDSQVIIHQTSSVPPHIVAYSELQMLWCVVGDQQVKMTADGIDIFNDYHRINAINEGVTISNKDYQVALSQAGIQMNDGSYGGLIIIEKLLERINALENDLNTLKDKFSSWAFAAQDGGKALREIVCGTPTGPALPTAWAGKPLEITSRASIENSLVKHGI